MFRTFGRAPVEVDGPGISGGFYCETVSSGDTYPKCPIGSFLTTRLVDEKVVLECATPTDTPAGLDIPNCKPGQYLSTEPGPFDKPVLACKKLEPVKSDLDVPACKPGEYLSTEPGPFDKPVVACRPLDLIIETRSVSCPVEYIAAGGSWGCRAECPDGYTVTGGGFYAPSAITYQTLGHVYNFAKGESRQVGNGWQCNLSGITSCSPGGGGKDGKLPCPSTSCTATCAKPVMSSKPRPTSISPE